MRAVDIGVTNLRDGGRVFVRWMTASSRQPEEILGIEEESFPEGLRWEMEDFLLPQECPESHCRIIRVALLGEEVESQRLVGFVVYNHIPGKRELLNMAVHPNFLRQGVGSALIQSLRQSDSRPLIARVPQALAAAGPFFEKHGVTVELVSKKRSRVDETTSA